MTTDRYLDRCFVPGKYDCLDFVREVWRDPALWPDGITRELGDTPRDLYRLRRLAAPRSPCLIVLRGAAETHLGVFLRGRVLHLAERGARFEPLERARMGFRLVRFYA